MVVTATLLRHHSLTLRDLSAAGCLFESRVALPVGTIGIVEIDFAGARRVETFRVCWSRQIAGAGTTTLLGAQFLPVDIAGERSLRAALLQLEDLAALDAADGREHDA